MISEYIISFFKSPTEYDQYNAKNIVKDMQEVRASIKALRAEMNDWHIIVKMHSAALEAAFKGNAEKNKEVKKQAKDKKRGKK